MHYSQQGPGGRTQVACLDRGVLSLGESLTLSTLEWPSDASVCSLWQVLEPAESIPSRFFLSSRACRGILHRAAKRDRTLPPLLEAALRSVADRPDTAPTEETEETEDEGEE